MNTKWSDYLNEKDDTDKVVTCAKFIRKHAFISEWAAVTNTNLDSDYRVPKKKLKVSLLATTTDTQSIDRLFKNNGLQEITKNIVLNPNIHIFHYVYNKCDTIKKDIFLMGCMIQPKIESEILAWLKSEYADLFEQVQTWKSLDLSFSKMMALHKNKQNYDTLSELEVPHE